MSIVWPYPEEEHRARVMCNDPQALALEWMKAYAENLSARAANAGEDYDTSPISVEDLFRYADSHINPGTRWGGDYIVRGGAFEGQSTDPTFWEKYDIWMGNDTPTDPINFFSCSC